MAITASASQQFVPIQEIRNKIVILKNGSYRGVLMTSTINFSLKSTDEQQSILFQFQNFLNTLDFPVQIAIQSRELNIQPYLATLKERYKKQVNELMKIQIQEYIEFIKEFTENTNIMSKHFYVIVPYTPAYNTNSGGILTSIKSIIPGISSSNEARKEIDEETFQENQQQLEERLAVVKQGLSRTGVRTARLGNEELTELYYQSFNPGETNAPVNSQ